MSSPAEMKKMSAITPRKTMRGHTRQVEGVAHLPGGQRIITCSCDGSLRLWDLESDAQIGDEWRDGGDEKQVRMMALSPNGKIVASGSQDGTVRLWDIETGKVVIKWEGHTQLVISMCWSPDSGQVVSGSFDGTARVWDVKSGKPVEGLNPIKTGYELLYAVSCSTEGTMIATGGYMAYGGRIDIRDAKTGKLLFTIKVSLVAVRSLTWTSDEKKLIAGVLIGSIRIFDTATWQQIAVLHVHDEPVSSITLFPNDRLLASTSYDKTARLWNLDTNLQVGSPLQHERDVTSAAFSADGKLLSTGCIDNNAYVWDIQAILKTSGLEDLLSVPDKPLAGTNATRRPPIRPVPRQLPADFFNNVQGRDPASDPSLHRRRRTVALSWGSRPHPLLTRLPQLFRRSQSNAGEPIESQQRPGPSTSSRRSPPVVEVPALDDKKALYTARRHERASDKAKRIKNPKWWARVVLFICCASPSTNEGH